MQAQGFTLPELMITLLVLTLLLTLGLPGFSKQIESTRTHVAATDLVQAINHARTLAVTRGKRATLRHRGHWTQGWELFVDENNNGLLDGNEILIMQSEPVKAVRIIASQPVRNYVSFVPSGKSRFVGTANGGAFQAGSFAVCPPTTGPGYKLVLSPSGRLRMDKLTTEECAPE